MARSQRTVAVSPERLAALRTLAAKLTIAAQRRVSMSEALEAAVRFASQAPEGALIPYLAGPPGGEAPTPDSGSGDDETAESEDENE